MIDNIVKQIYLKMLIGKQYDYIKVSTGDAISLLDYLIDTNKGLPNIWWIHTNGL